MAHSFSAGLPGLGASLSGGLSGLSAELNGALSGVAPFQTLFTAGSPAAFMTQLRAMELNFNNALINGR